MKSQDITVTYTTSPKPKVPDDQLVFGRTFTDHMFIMDYKKGVGWYNPRIVPYQPLTLEPFGGNFPLRAIRF